MPNLSATILFCGLFLALNCDATLAQPVRGPLSMNTSNVSSVKKSSFGKTADGTAVELYTLTNKSGAIAKVTTYGATLTELFTADKSGKLTNIILGFDNLHQYEQKTNPHFGGTIGRFANRIAGGQFKVDGKEYTLAKNNGPNTLHGGMVGWDRRVWQAIPGESPDGPLVKFTYTSDDGEEGFPGTVKTDVTYTLTNDNSLKIDYSATTDKITPLNLTNHAYFNLAGAGNGDVLNHDLTILADNYTPTDDTLIPTGEIAPVKDTPLDFTKTAKVGSRIDQLPHGYDHNFVLSMKPRELTLSARLHEPTAGRTMEMWTTEPGVQLYTAYWLDGALKGNGGAYNRYYAICLEAQHFPDGVNKPSFPTSFLEPGKEYRQTTVYKFLSE